MGDSDSTGLAERFLAALPADAARGTTAAEIEAPLAALCAAGRAAWPGVALDDDALVRALSRHARAGEAIGVWLAGVHAADFYIAAACAERRPRALAAFDERYLAQVGGFLARMRPDPAFVDDIRQELRAHLLVAPAGGAPRIAEYSGRGALAGFLRVVTLRLAIDARRKRGEILRDAGEDDEPRTWAGAARDPELSIIRRRYAPEFKRAFAAAFAALTSEQRNLLRLHFGGGATLDQLAATFRVHRATVARWIAGARAAIVAETRRLLEEKLALGPGEFESMLGVLRVRLDLSLPGFLRDDGWMNR